MGYGEHGSTSADLLGPPVYWVGGHRAAGASAQDGGNVLKHLVAQPRYCVPRCHMACQGVMEKAGHSKNPDMPSCGYVMPVGSGMGI
jgi:hypothetical protein